MIGLVDHARIEILGAIADTERRIVALERGIVEAKLSVEDHQYQADAHTANARHARLVLEDRERQLSAARGECLDLYRERDSRNAN